MEIKVEIKRLNELIQAFEKAPGEVRREMRLALAVSLRDVQRRARAQHRFRTRSGNLERDIDSEIIQDWPVVGRVFINRTVTKIKGGKWASHSYGEFVHEGTSDHFVEPRKRMALRWVGKSGRFVFSRGHRVRGIKKDQFLYKAAENERASINATFERYTLRALQKAGIT